MRRMFLFTVIICFLISGCATIKGERIVTDNVFFSTEPKFKFKVSPEFEYLGTLEFEQRGKTVDGGYPLKLERETHGFVANQGSVVTKAIIVSLLWVESSFSSDFFFGVKGKLDSGVCGLGGKKYQYCTLLMYPDSGAKLTRYAINKGYIVPACGLYRFTVRLLGKRGDLCMFIDYFESLDGAEFPCSTWQNCESPSPEQKEYLKNFNERFYSSVKF